MRRKRKTRVRFIPLMRWMVQWYILSFGLIIAMMSIVLLVGKAVEQHNMWSLIFKIHGKQRRKRNTNSCQNENKKADETITDFLN